MKSPFSARSTRLDHYPNTSNTNSKVQASSSSIGVPSLTKPSSAMNRTMHDLTGFYYEFMERVRLQAWTMTFLALFLVFVYILLFVDERTRISNDSAKLCAFVTLLFAGISMM